LILSFNMDIPAGPAIVLTAGGFWVLSLLTGPLGSLWRQAMPSV
jgi:zinc/manganese transport system permease protein